MRWAERILRAFAAEVVANPAPVEPWTVERWAREQYLPSLAGSRKPYTLASYEQMLRTLVVPHVGSIELTKLTVDDVDELDRKLSEHLPNPLSLVSRPHARGLHAKSKP